MRKDLEQKVEATLASFDKAVKQSCTRRNDANGQEKQEELELDLVNLIKDSITGEKEAGPADKPSCRPWDYAAFSARLGTFTPLNWFSKPAFASPPMCARYGWVNTGRDTLSCQCCGAKMHFRETADEASGNAVAADAGQEAIPIVDPVSSSSFLSRLKSQHHDLCPWNGNACPQDFLQLPPMAREDLVAEFLARLDSLLSVVTATALPEVLLPSSFEERCPGGLSTLAAKARAVLARQSLCSPDSGDALAAMPTAATKDPAPAPSENGEKLAEGNKRQRDGGNVASAAATAAAGDAAGGGGADGGGKLSGFGDEVLGAAAALAVFGWRSASPSAGGGSSSNESVAANADGSAKAPKSATKRLSCALCKRRVVTDNFLTLEVDEGNRSSAGSSGGGGGDAEFSSSDGRAEGGRSGKRRRLSGGGTPLKRMDLAMEHRSFCPWANVHPLVEGEAEIGGVQADVQGAVPGWRQTLEALLEWVDPARQEVERTSVSSGPEEALGIDEADIGKAGEALQNVQKVLGVLMRY